MPSPADVPFEAANQGGVFTRRQAYDEGWTARQVRRRLEFGRWRVVAGDGLTSVETTIGPRQLAHAAVLTWPDAVVSHQLAGALHGFAEMRATVATTTVPLSRSRRAVGLVAHRWLLSPGEVQQLGRVPVTTARRTALDLLRCLSWEEAGRLWAWLATRSVVTPADLERDLADADRRRGGNQIRRLLTWTRSGAVSPAEVRLHALLRRAGLVGWQANAPVRAQGRVIAVADVLFAEARVVIEVDGYDAHSGRESFQRDRSRQNDLVAAGYLVLRFTWADLERRPRDVVRRISAALSGTVGK